MPLAESEVYSLPTDATDHQRLEVQHHALIALQHGKAFHAPVSNPKRILDIGCGTGIFTALLAKHFPSASVLGVDSQPVPKSNARINPPNVEYMTGDFRSLVASHILQPASFDFIFSRMLVVGMPSYDNYVATVASLLVPGGWFECQEYNFLVRNAAGDLISQDLAWMNFLNARFRERGLDPLCGMHSAQYFRDAGFEQISYEEFPFVRKPWTARPETALIGQYVQTAGVRPIHMAMDHFAAAEPGRWSPEELAELKRDCEDSIRDTQDGDHCVFTVCCGRKAT